MKERIRSCFLPLLLAALFACGTNDPPVRRYHVRALVKEVSGSGADLRVALHHERIPNFEDRDGKRSEMSAMTMVFGVAPEVAVAQLKAGAKVEVDFDVRWSQAPALLVVSAAALPEGTELVLPPDHH